MLEFSQMAELQALIVKAVTDSRIVVEEVKEVKAVNCPANTALQAMVRTDKKVSVPQVSLSSNNSVFSQH